MCDDVVSGKPAVTDEQLLLLFGEIARLHVAAVDVDPEIALVRGHLHTFEGAEVDDAARDFGAAVDVEADLLDRKSVV